MVISVNRIGRLELLFWCVMSILGGGILLAIVAIITNTTIEPDSTRHPWPQALPFIAASLVILKAHVSRFHDLGWSGRWVLLTFVPLVDIVVFLFLLLAPGQKARNSFGEPPVFLQRLRNVRKAD